MSTWAGSARTARRAGRARASTQIPIITSEYVVVRTASPPLGPRSDDPAKRQREDRARADTEADLHERTTHERAYDTAAIGAKRDTDTDLASAAGTA